MSAPALGQSAPSCVPATLGNSALQGGLVAMSPLPGSRDASPQTQISILGVAPHRIRTVTVSGSLSGAHSGGLARYSGGRGAGSRTSS